MAKNINISDLSFDGIKDNIKKYMENDKVFKDYNFEGSALSSILDILTYNTYYNSYYMNMIANESFLDTARIRENVVSKAKLLGYTPRSNKSATALVAVTFKIIRKNRQERDYQYNTLRIDRQLAFSTSFDNESFIFVPKISRSITRSRSTTEPDGSRAHYYTINDLELLQGQQVEEKFVVDINNPNQKFILSNETVDTDTIQVLVQASAEDDVVTEFKLATDTTQLSDISKTYFLQESKDMKYEIFFGDGVLGDEVENGNIITVRYITTKGANGNGITGRLTAVALPKGVIVDTENVQIIGESYGGADREDIDSIKFFAPRTFESQNRAVTARDYKANVPQIYPEVDTMNVWGGEDNDPPAYGSVFMSIKPNTGLILSTQEKQYILNQLKSNYSVLTLSPQIVDPDYLKLKITTNVKYNDEATLLDESALKESVRQNIISYNNEFLNEFNSYFRYSQFLSAIDKTDDSVTNNITEILMINEKTPVYNGVASYTFNFNNPIRPNSLYSNAFTIAGSSDPHYIEDDGLGGLRIYTLTPLFARNYNNVLGGTINYGTGKVVLNDIQISGIIGSTVIGLVAEPESNDIFPVRNQIIFIDYDELDIVMMPDTDEFNENYDISSQRVVVTRSLRTTYNTSQASITNVISDTTT